MGEPFQPRHGRNSEANTVKDQRQPSSSIHEIPDDGILQVRIKQFNEAYTKWKGQHDLLKTEKEKKEHRFNCRWLERNGFSNLYNWVKDTPPDEGGTWEVFLKKIDDSVVTFFKIPQWRDRNTVADFDDAKTRFLAAYTEWKKEHDALKTDAERKKHRFNLLWLQKNNLYNLRYWMERTPADQGGTWETFIQRVGGDAGAAFSRSKGADPINDFDGAKTRFLAAYTEWKKEHDALKTDAERKKHRFSPEWLQKKKLNNLCYWAERTPADQGGTWETFIQRVGGDAGAAFSKLEMSESINDFDDAKTRFLAAYTEWKKEHDALKTDAERKKHRFSPKGSVAKHIKPQSSTT